MPSLYYKTPKTMKEVKEIETYGYLLKDKKNKIKTTYRQTIEVSDSIKRDLQKLKLIRKKSMQRIVLELLAREIRAAKQSGELE